MAEETLLIEIGTEELPPCHLEEASFQFATTLATELSALGFNFGNAENFVSPRRIAARIFGIPSQQPSRVLQKKGAFSFGRF